MVESPQKKKLVNIREPGASSQNTKSLNCRMKF